MSNEEFEKYKDSLAVILFEKPKGSMEQAAVYQLEIDKQNYNFNRAEIESEALKSINKMDIIQFYADQISQFGPKRHKLAVHIKSSLKITNENNQFSQSDNSLGANNSTIIMDITDFKKKHRLYSLPIPFIPVGYKTFF
ncbi:Metalloenzyme, LuxS/M16 peptidase-like [Cinara cedri]|uniref:Metalloenzyme, LuxS/M16 peptidase-like n=1 Tax=Cinara cedri TaxID=506608 RepID=A0A5E4N7A7_9HEMI|nr:Metalloenzyme, LuxS/M16 peptidase-like [Cinara cedri]